MSTRRLRTFTLCLMQIDSCIFVLSYHLYIIIHIYLTIFCKVVDRQVWKRIARTVYLKAVSILVVCVDAVLIVPTLRNVVPVISRLHPYPNLSQYLVKRQELEVHPIMQTVCPKGEGARHAAQVTGIQFFLTH